MPKRYVSSMRLCMSGSTDYWVNNQMGQPFFVVPKTINEGLIKTLLDDIIPRLNRDVPNQPSEAELAANEKLHRFMIVFDREGYSAVIEPVEISIFLKNLPGSVSHFARIEKMSMKIGMIVNFLIMK